MTSHTITSIVSNATSAGCRRSPVTESKHKVTMNESKRRVADLSKPVNPTPEQLAKFFAKVDKTSSSFGCWLWTGFKSPEGYGGINFLGNVTVASRVSWIIHYGPIPANKLVCHNCPGGDNPACVNPAHLWLGTYKENTRDQVLKGRHSQSKLSDESVIQIRQRKANGEKQSALAAEFNVSEAAIWGVVKRHYYTHI